VPTMKPPLPCCAETVLRLLNARRLVDGGAGDHVDQVRCACGRRLMAIQSTQASLQCSVCGHRTGALRNAQGEAIPYPRGGIVHNCSEDSCNRDRWFDVVPFPPDPERDHSGDPPGPEPPQWLRDLVDGSGPPDDGGPAPDPPTPGR
jgi:hypothetical protein